MGFLNPFKKSVSQVISSSVPKVNKEPKATDQDRLRRAGRASLISTTQQGILGTAPTNRRQLTAV